jgi:hypothetical protein
MELYLISGKTENLTLKLYNSEVVDNHQIYSHWNMIDSERAHWWRKGSWLGRLVIWLSCGVVPPLKVMCSRMKGRGNFRVSFCCCVTKCVNSPKSSYAFIEIIYSCNSIFLRPWFSCRERNSRSFLSVVSFLSPFSVFFSKDKWQPALLKKHALIEFLLHLMLSSSNILRHFTSLTADNSVVSLFRQCRSVVPAFYEEHHFCLTNSWQHRTISAL